MAKSFQDLLLAMRRLRLEVGKGSKELLSHWEPKLARKSVKPSVDNLAHYIALRRFDLRKLQSNLASAGLSSLGHCESKVLPTLDAVIANLECLSNSKSWRKRSDPRAFTYGERKLQLETRHLLGKARSNRTARIVATLPGENAKDVSWLAELMKSGMDIARINMAHDDPDTWENMVHSLARASKRTGVACRILMDLGGPKLRTGSVTPITRKNRLYQGDKLWLSTGESPPPDFSDAAFWVRCTLPEAVRALKLGDRVYLDDGSVSCLVKSKTADGVLLEIIRADENGKKLKADKGINMPDTPLSIPALTKKDGEDIPFALKHSHLLGYSFVQVPEDILNLHQAMLDLGRKPRQGPFLILKIETAKAIRHFPNLCVTAMGVAPTGIMIARGDLAVEIGFLRLAEMQEELLWLCEAAHLPVIWATQVLEGLSKKGLPSRAEITDAAMAARASAVMLNKGLFLNEAVSALDEVLTRMQGHHQHKTPLMRALLSW